MPDLQKAVRWGIPPLITFFVIVLIWQSVTALFVLPPYLVPGPGLVWHALVTNFPELLQATFLTGLAALSGFTASFVVGLLTAFAFAQSEWIQRSLYPYAIFLQTVPIVGIAPIIIIWFGSGFVSVVLVSFIISLFPIITNGTAGLTRIPPERRELFAVYNASRWQELRWLRLPNSVPYLITGAKISSGLSVIGAIVGEFFAGYGSAHHGLGYLIVLTSGQLKTAFLFAAIGASTILGLVIFASVDLMGRLFLRRWQYH